MADAINPLCPECAVPVPDETLDRRHFVRLLGGATAGALVLGASASTPVARADTAKQVEKDSTKKKPAEAIVKELVASLQGDQKKQVLLPWDHGAGKGRIATRLGMYNGSLDKTTTIGKVYNNEQFELIQRIIKAISSGDDGVNQLSRGGDWDASGDLKNCGAHIFGDPTSGKYSWVLSGHHITVRCDGNSEEGTAFGGPLYYGHSPNGYSDRNVFHYQTKAVLEVFKALSEKQRKLAVIEKSPGELAPSIRFRKPEEKKPGLSFGEMSQDQQALVEKVMRVLVSPFRKEDADEVMEIVKANGGMQKMHLGFFKKADTKEGQWDFWRLEGPGFVWNFRVLPHVHTYVNCCRQI